MSIRIKTMIHTSDIELELIYEKEFIIEILLILYIIYYVPIILYNT